MMYIKSPPLLSRELKGLSVWDHSKVKQTKLIAD